MYSSVFPAVFYNITFQFEYFTYFFSNFFLSTSFSSFSSSPPFLLTPLPRFYICNPSNRTRKPCCKLPLSSALEKAVTSHAVLVPSQLLATLNIFPPQKNTPWDTVARRNKAFARHWCRITLWGSHWWFSVALAHWLISAGLWLWKAGTVVTQRHEPSAGSQPSTCPEGQSWSLESSRSTTDPRLALPGSVPESLQANKENW